MFTKKNLALINIWCPESTLKWTSKTDKNKSFFLPSLFAPITTVYPQLFNNQYLSIHPPHTCVKHSQGLRQLILMSSISQKWRRQRLLIPILLWRYLRMYVHLVVSGTFSSASRVGLLVFWLRSSAESKLEKANFLSDFEKREVQKFVV